MKSKRRRKYIRIDVLQLPLPAIYQAPEELSCTRKKKRQEESGEFHIEPGVHALYFTYRGSGSMDWQWFEFC